MATERAPWLDAACELAEIRALCASAGCSDPGEECADRTLAMVEELRQRGVCRLENGHLPTAGEER